MFVSGRGRGGRMPCESCAVQFSIFRLKRQCGECGRVYCAGCMRRGGGSMCASCRALCTRPLYRHAIAHLRVRDLQCFLHRQNVSTRGCVEKDELVNLCIAYVNSPEYRRGRGSFGSSLKGLTSNINNLIHSAFDIRNYSQTPGNNCYNRSHAHSTAAPRPPTTGNPGTPAGPPMHERFTTTPGGEADITVPVPSPDSVHSGGSAGAARLESADCFEVEDLDDTWELLHAPGTTADTLPNDSAELLSTSGVGVRATSELDLSRSHSRDNTDSVSLQEDALHDTTLHSDMLQDASLQEDALHNTTLHLDVLQDAPLHEDALHNTTLRLDVLQDAPLHEDALHNTTLRLDVLQDAPLHENALLNTTLRLDALNETTLNEDVQENVTSPETNTPSHAPPPQNTAPPPQAARASLAALESLGAVEALSVRQLKELLVRNRVAIRGCLERKDLLERARQLWTEHAKYKDQVDSLPLEECCKICMAAPLECVLLECGHIATCTACATPLRECPICRRYVARAVRFFRS